MFSGIIPLLPPNYTKFDATNNKLSGEIWIETGKRLSKCSLILLLGNEFSGSIPFSIFPTTGKSIDQESYYLILDLSRNKLTGSIPTNIWRWSNINFISGLHCLEYHNLANNNFGGKLTIISLRSNKLYGSIPKGILHLKKLCALDLSMNNLSGHIPTKLGN
ncbi:hypothetical protein MKW92_018667 [Papaver armeniacum]|nr:hypothetical protein MKW92_018667 [Papaver armeniacum]